MKTMDVQTHPASLSELVDLARREAGVVLTRAGQPVARVLPWSESVTERVAPLHPGAMEAGEDFDAPLPDEFWLGKE
jgi:antitoxin (DNA-binding transcriptional repressor) of toxin-antitoxin stability system